MKLCLDPDKVYAVALEGGGGRGAYEIGAWQAFEEAGLRFGAVAGTSVGALNGALMVMGDLKRATDVWYNIQMTQVLNVDEQREKDLRLLLAGKPSLGELFGALQRNAGLLKEGGLDVSPLRSWIREVVDPETLASSPVDLYVTTVDVAEK
ncbi:MAG: patatin-like phospholipase family protein, partial [Clostridia bacterium]|nr:patatin-like phospholipase family protein [Clostridia bacterium]